MTHATRSGVVVDPHPIADVIICGAGPAGSSLAIHLARQGRHVLLLDRAEFPREKACGEGVMPAGVAALERLGVHTEGAPFVGVRYHHAGRTVTGRFPDGAKGLGIRRSVLDTQLLDAARAENNVHVLTGIAAEVPCVEKDRVAGVFVAGLRFRAPLTVAADGANSLLRHKLGWDASPASQRFGVRRHYRVPASEDPVSPGPSPGLPAWVDVYIERTGTRSIETYVTPLSQGQLLVATLGDTRGELPSPLRHLDPIDEPLGAAPLAVRASQRFCEGCVLLGDAAGSCDPITGGGISQALLSSELLARHLGEEFPPSLTTLAAFDRAREAMLVNYRRLTAGVLALSEHPAFLKPVLSILHHTPGLFSRLLAIAGGQA